MFSKSILMLGDVFSGNSYIVSLSFNMLYMKKMYQGVLYQKVNSLIFNFILTDDQLLFYQRKLVHPL